MPRLRQEIIDSVFFLFRDEDEARSGRAPGGTGFIVAVQSERDPSGIPYYYAVSTHHGAVRAGYSCVRVNCHDGNTDVFGLDPSEWHFCPMRGDIAVVKVDLDPNIHKTSSVPHHLLATQEYIAENNVGVGEDVFMLGLFLDSMHPTNYRTNLPMARFGHISMIPSNSAFFNLRDYGAQNYFILDMHSRSGFSGSPIFMFRLGIADLTHEDFAMALYDNHLFSLLAMHCGQFREDWEIEMIKRTGQTDEADAVSVNAGTRIRGLSGMTFAVPAWAISSLLASDRLSQERANLDAKSDSAL